MRRERIGYEFVQHIPRELEEGVLYVSLEYAVTAHRCCCGCGAEVSLPLAPVEWKLIFDGPEVSLTPSIGRPGWPCESHYIIRQGRVLWLESLTPEIAAAHVRRADAGRAVYYGRDDESVTAAANAQLPHKGLWSRLKRRLAR
jgi:Family of unknown function (DUF6527)